MAHARAVRCGRRQRAGAGARLDAAASMAHRRGDAAVAAPERSRPGAAADGPEFLRPADPGYRREVSSATMSAEDCRCFARATPCPAHIESASMSPVLPT